jgi:ABC-type sugar transport system permease subunit
MTAAPKTHSRSWSDLLGSYGFVLPALLIFAVFYVYPFYKVFALSLYSWDGVSPSATFVGLANFRNVIGNDPYWWQSMRQAGFITLFALTFQNALALALALACDRAIRYSTVYRVIFFIPPVLSEIVVGLVWKWIYNGQWGLLNSWLTALGLESLTRTWLGDSESALVCVAVVHAWKGFGWGFIILLAGLQSIPSQLYEAAAVDGAGSWRAIWRVTFPLMVPTFFMVTILTVLGSMQVFALILAMTGGGPGYHTEVPVTRIIASMINSSRFGYACAQGIVFGAILLLVSFIQIRAARVLKQA